MKTKILALVAVLIFAAVSFSQASTTKEKVVKNLSGYLNKTLQFPAFAQDNEIEGSVSLVVSVDENHKLKVSSIKGTCCDFEKYVEEWFSELEKKPISFSDEIGMKKVVIHFKLM